MGQIIIWSSELFLNLPAFFFVYWICWMNAGCLCTLQKTFQRHTLTFFTAFTKSSGKENWCLAYNSVDWCLCLPSGTKKWIIQLYCFPCLVYLKVFCILFEDLLENFAQRHKKCFTVGLSLCIFRMITDVQLAIFANALGVTLFLLVVLYHYVSVNSVKKD